MSGTYHAHGAVASTGAEITVEAVGFPPRSVHLHLGGAAGAAGGGASATWHKPMPEGAAHKIQSDGDGSYVVTGGITPTATGFKIGTDADINPSGGLIIFWEVWG